MVVSKTSRMNGHKYDSRIWKITIELFEDRLLVRLNEDDRLTIAAQVFRIQEPSLIDVFEAVRIAEQPARRHQSLANSFARWLHTEGQDIVEEIQVQGSRAQVSIGFRRFPELLGLLRRTSMNIAAVRQGEGWGFLLERNVRPSVTKEGWICRECREPVVFASRDDLWRDHLFQPFRTWVLKEVATASCVVFDDHKGMARSARLI